MSEYNPYPTQATPDITRDFIMPVQESLPTSSFNKQREYSFNGKVVSLLLMFNIHEYSKYLQISAAWHCVINETMDEYTNKIENDFVKTYSKSLHFLKSYMSATPIKFCKEVGTRLDRIF